MLFYWGGILLRRLDGLGTVGRIISPGANDLSPSGVRALFVSTTEDSMTSPFVAGRLQRLRRAALLFVFLVPLVSVQLIAKTVGLTAIEVYPGTSGMSYEQISGFVLNGKNEVYLCPETPEWDKSVYRKLRKITLTSGMSLERNAKGSLMLTQESSASACVVPGNIKLDKGDSLTPSGLADKATLEGSVLPASDPQQTQIFPLKVGVKIVFVDAPNQELAEFLRADKAGDIPAWEAFLKKGGSGPHAIAAKKALAQLYTQSATSAFAAYEGSKNGTDPQYSKLKTSRQLTDQAKILVPDYKDALSLSDKVHADVVEMAKSAIQRLDLYRSALNQKKPGFSNLPAAEKLADSAIDIEPSTSDATDAEKQTKQARGSYEGTLRESEGLIASQNPDEAAQRIKPLICFSNEVRRISEDLQAISTLYVNHAKRSGESEKWPDAVNDLKKAGELVASQDTQALLAEAQAKAEEAANRAAAEEAMKKSADFEGGGDIISAFEVVDDLPKEPRTLVLQRIADLKDKYIQAAEKEAKSQQNAHTPINGLADEIGIQTAYEHLQRCYRLTGDPDFRDRTGILGDYLSGYYLKQGKRYTEKPDGTGANVGWTYLAEALRYKSTTNSSAAHDAQTTARPEHLLKEKLSVKVAFRDGTSRRVGAQFADQLSDALASQLESSGYQIKIVRSETTAVQPNFQLIGDVLEHSMTNDIQKVSKPSMYRASEQEVPNEDWTKLSREIEKINRDSESARRDMDVAESHGKKKEMAAANAIIKENNAKVDEMQAKLDRIAKTISQPVVRDYEYVEVTHSHNVTVELQFHVLDSSATEVVPRRKIHKETPLSYTVRENVSPEDTKGIKSDTTIPDENRSFEKTEYEARDSLIEQAKEELTELPGIVLHTADRKAMEGDSDGAAELYILYLNCTPVADTAERTKAQKFLLDQFNFKDIGKVPPSD